MKHGRRIREKGNTIIQTKYKVITEDLIKKIATGFFKKGDKFYSESEIKEIYNVSSTTAVKVMDNLVQLGRVERFQGKGTFVSKNNSNELLEVTDVQLRNELVKNVNIVSVEEEHDNKIKQLLNISGSYYKIVRTYHIGNNIISDVNISYIPVEYVKNFHLKNPEDFTSIYKLYNEDFNIDAYALPFTQNNSIRNLPDDFLISSFDESKKLDYCFYQERTTYLKDGSVLEYLNDYKNPNQFAQTLKRRKLYDE